MLQSAHQAYHRAIPNYKGRIVTIDAERGLEVVVGEVVRHIKNTFE